ncbi:hypothetical protein [Sorangium cellulosum]|uniref:hypothetical protein n=1 Tax=Sorangium cellulosum TaxID=56 RepID=UPI0012FFAC5E|nr:hypothetical protein [Sorangium cellulosum]
MSDGSIVPHVGNPARETGLERRQSPERARASKQAQLAAAVPVAGDRAGLIEIQSAPADARFVFGGSTVQGGRRCFKPRARRSLFE